MNRFEKVKSIFQGNVLRERMEEIYERQLERPTWNDEELNQLTEFLGKPRIELNRAYLLNFGKHAGKDIRDIPLHYLIYLVKGDGRFSIDDDQRKVVMSALLKRSKQEKNSEAYKLALRLINEKKKTALV